LHHAETTRVQAPALQAFAAALEEKTWANAQDFPAASLSDE